MKNIKLAKSASIIVTNCLAAGLLLFSANAHAEYLGLMSGRSADVASLTEKSVEAGFVTGDISDGSYQSFGARFNFRVSPEAMLYLDVSKVEFEDQDGTAYGLGFLYQLDGVLENSDIAIKGAFHKAKLKETDQYFEFEGDVISIEALISGEQLGTSNLGWYANLGMHKFDFDGYDETEIGFGGGVFMPTSFGEFYAGADMIDELTFGFGIRYFLQ